jgi:hypothetical protein
MHSSCRVYSFWDWVFMVLGPSCRCRNVNFSKVLLEVRPSLIVPVRRYQAASAYSEGTSS